MTDEQAATFFNYLGAIALGVALAGGAVLLQQLQSGREIDWTPVLVAALSSLLTALRSAQLPKAGEKPLADRLTAAQTRQVADELERRMKRTPAPKAKG